MATYPDGLDCVWLGIDGKGHAAAFVTGGEGPIPTHSLASGDLNLDDIEKAVLEMPRISDAKVLVDVKRPDSFIALVERGLYVYDWSDVQRSRFDALGGYELVAVPASPLVVDEDVDDPRLLSTAAALTQVAFGSERVLKVQNVVECATGETALE